MTQQNTKKGFTLLELLVVITILAILMVIVVIFINPVETLRQGRDAQRLSDLRTMKTAISLFLNKTGNTLGGSSACVSSGPAANGSADATKVHASLPCTGTGGTCTAYPITNANANYAYTTEDRYQLNDGTGWVNLNFSNLTQGPIISNLPIDPVNTAAGALYYRYVCKTDDTYEMDGNLESTQFGDKETKDGGDSNTDTSTTESARYETGADLRLLPKYAPTA
jgi:prepilin-type N-terminal cleavage/methylation domain-containing protein